MLAGVGAGRQAGHFQCTLWGQAMGQSLQLSWGLWEEDRTAHRQQLEREQLKEFLASFKPKF